MKSLPLIFTLPIAAMLMGCGNGAPTCGTVPYPSNTNTVTPSPILDSPQVWSFISEPNLHPNKITVNTFQPGTSSDLIFIDPFTFSSVSTYGQPGGLILDNSGNPFWFLPLSSPNLMINNLETQQLNGKPVLIYWQGTIATPPTYTNIPMGGAEPGGCYYILDDTYRVKQTVTAHNGFDANFHDFVITPNNTALFLTSKVVPMDLTPYGGPQDGSVYDSAVEEVDLQTNQLVFFWDALDHIPLGDSYQAASTASMSNDVWDAYHLNSVGLTDQADDILVSGRNTSTIYRINKPTGHIVWQLGGMHSDFTITSGAEFSWQHDARLLPNNVVSMFDDGCCEGPMIPPGTPPSHGLILQLDFATMTASATSQYYHNPNFIVPAQGSTQTLPNGNVFVGWGGPPNFSEYAAAGNTSANPAVNSLYDAQMPGNNSSYRAFRLAWTATPYYPPSAAAKLANGQVTVYASWNGSTETDSWQVLGGGDGNHLSLITTVKKSGFETAIPVASAGPFFQVNALSATGQVIGMSAVVKAQ